MIRFRHLLVVSGVVVGASWVAAQTSTPPAATPEAPSPAKVAPDRSGEALLRELFRTHQGLQGTRLLIRVDNRSSETAPYLYSRAIELWIGEGGRFRSESVAAFGGGPRVISDGKTVVTDPMRMGAPVVLTTASPTVWEAQELANPSRATPLIWLAEGEKGMDRILVPESFIREVPAPNGRRAVQVGTTLAGVIEFTFRADDPNKRVIGIEFDSAPDWRIAVRGGQAFVAMGGSRTRQALVWAEQGAKFASSLFDTSVPKGMTSVDRRRPAGAAAPATATRPPESEPSEETPEGDGSPVLP